MLPVLSIGATVATCVSTRASSAHWTSRPVVTGLRFVLLWKNKCGVEGGRFNVSTYVELQPLQLKAYKPPEKVEKNMSCKVGESMWLLELQLDSEFEIKSEEHACRSNSC